MHATARRYGLYAREIRHVASPFDDESWRTHPITWDGYCDRVRLRQCEAAGIGHPTGGHRRPDDVLACLRRWMRGARSAMNEPIRPDVRRPTPTELESSLREAVTSDQLRLAFHPNSISAPAM